MPVAEGPYAHLPWRLGVGVMLVDGAGRVFVAERIDSPGAWQMPQGGIDAGEDPLAAARRELLEETGTTRADFIACTRDWQSYDLPDALVESLWGGRRYRGQKQKWYLARFAGTDADIDIAAHDPPEFSAWRWVAPAELPGLIVEFKRDLYRRLVTCFGPVLAGAAGGDEVESLL